MGLGPDQHVGIHTELICYNYNTSTTCRAASASLVASAPQCSSNCSPAVHKWQGQPSEVIGAVKFWYRTKIAFSDSCCCMTAGMQVCSSMLCQHLRKAACRCMLHAKAWSALDRGRVGGPEGHAYACCLHPSRCRCHGWALLQPGPRHVCGLLWRVVL